MAEFTLNNSPVHSDSILTAVFGDTGKYWARYHTGIDFVPYGNTEATPLLYSVCKGVVYSILYNKALGNQVILKDNDGKYWRYCHLKEKSSLVEGSIVDYNTVIGIMGKTGNATGIHLHLEYSKSPYWSYDYFLNPAEKLGIDNKRGTIIHYKQKEDEPIPEPKEKTKNKFKWVLYAKKLRNKQRYF